MHLWLDPVNNFYEKAIYSTENNSADSCNGSAAITDRRSRRYQRVALAGLPE